MPAVVGVDVSQVVRPVDNHLLGVNLAWWDSSLNTSQTQQMVRSAGLTMFRFPGGSSSDDWHFNAPPTYSGKGTSPSMAGFIASVGGTGLVTLDYGSGSPQEAAAFLAYLNASPTNTTVIGNGPEWNDTTSTWVTTNWKTAGYWAGLRAAAPLTQDDGLNFLRIGRAAPFGFHYFEVGNEVYGSWETDHHTLAHDPATYITFARQFAGLAASIDPTISIGVVTGSIGYDNHWTANILQQCATQGFIPGFLSDHLYMQAPGSESDANLLLDTVSDPNNQDPNSPDDWALRAAGYRQLLQQKLGASASKVELRTTEFNSVYSNPGKQTTSLVNGLFTADSLGSLLETEYNGAMIWDLRNGWDTSNNNSSSLYGWRQGGDYGLLGSPGGSLPSTGPYVPYPTYFAEQLVAQMVHPGDTVVHVSSNDPNLSVYAVHEATGHLDLLVINKSPTANLSGQFQVTGFLPGTGASVWQYGKTQDTAQSQTTDGHSALAHFSTTLSVSGSSFSYTFPSYSMTVLDIAPGSSTAKPPTVATPASATPNPVTGKTTTLKVLGADAAGEASLIYTWAVNGTPPAPVTFSANGTNAAKNTTATFAQAGTYSFVVTITDHSGLSTTSTVTVTVARTAVLVVSPASASFATGTTHQLTAQEVDQFGSPLPTQPAFTWSVTGVGTISTSGLYSAPTTTGSATVRATAGALSGSAAVTVVISAAGHATATFADTTDWGTGFTGSITIANPTTTAINGWTLQFDFTGNIYQIWNATIVSHVGNHYVISNVSYNSTIAAGGSVNFGFNASPGNVTAGPTNYILNGVFLGAGHTPALLKRTSFLSEETAPSEIP
jgi:hypothetical protein